LTLAYDQTVLRIDLDDAPAAGWLTEFLGPWFVPATRSPDWRLTVAAARGLRDARAARRPRDAPSRACFALDQQVVALPAWTEDDGIVVDDAERSCTFVLGDAHVRLLADPTTRRWRFTLQWLCHEIAATRLRRTALDLHAAAVATAGAAIVIAGAKGAGKTTLSFHLLRSGGCRWISNDRAFLDRHAGAFRVRGMPTPVKILAPTLRSFPELRCALAALERPYLHALHEVVGQRDAGAAPSDTEFALSPAQLAHQLGIVPLDAAPLGAVVFPEIRPNVAGFAVERLAPADVAARLWQNQYGMASARREATLFEELDGGRVLASHADADAIAGSVPGYRILLGPDAYDDPRFAERLLERVST
jgi:hypothetical protein